MIEFTAAVSYGEVTAVLTQYCIEVPHIYCGITDN